MPNEIKREEGTESKAWDCKHEDSSRCCHSYSRGRCWLWIIGGIVLLFLTFHIGWYAALKYQATTGPVNQSTGK
ncbi:MAG: hypothetical protein IPJ68_05545 [Candidatus Moraniibacteriota bacterium]|nr:MAG: hypothetical protein IPJ68_05545 [Candidatus Moranbacteria bacterium]